MNLFYDSANDHHEERSYAEGMARVLNGVGLEKQRSCDSPCFCVMIANDYRKK